MTKFKTKDLTLAAIFCALTAVLSQISIPLPFTPVPINLAMLSPFLAGALLGPTLGSASQLTYIIMGAIGLPVFAGFSGGLGIAMGPTGGYIIGYVAAALVTGLLCHSSTASPFRKVCSMSAGLLACYSLGTLWFMFVTKNPLLPSLSMCVIPFLGGDALKITAAVLLSKKLAPLLSSNRKVKSV